MIISFKAGLAYLAAPKTGSTAIEAELRPASHIIFQGNAHSKHLTLREYQALVVPLLNHVTAPEIETLAVIREPVDWVRSWYSYRQRPAERPEHSTRGLSFDEFLDGFEADTQAEVTQHIGDQARFVVNEAGDVGVDHLFRYDEMPALHSFLGRRFNRQFAFRPLNVSPRVKLEISPAQRERIERFFPRDVEIYNAVQSRAV
ncbi:hypothetical protein [Oceanibium sediminis]|uniref:hypothetical protein n=1 Tax=Oceanibium sediminis TaxID=2026339 RepID=UPI000DD3FC67|nr:hypothetical protein [Oceanibium sediminis]